MKKKYIVAILLGLMTCMLTGCSTDSIPSFHAMLFGEEEYVSLGYDPSDYVTLGKYKNIEVEKSVSDSDVQSALDSMIAAGDEKEVKSSDTVVKKNQLINFDYEGKGNGKAFDGGTAESQFLRVGSGKMIDGFEDALVGMKVGEKKDAKVTFPKDYRETSLAGKEAVFTLKVNYIYKEATDALVAKLDSAYNTKTVKAFKEAAKKVATEKVSAGKVAAERVPAGKIVLLECMSNLVANEMFSEENLSAVMDEAKVKQLSHEIISGVTALQDSCDILIIVTNQIFEDGIRYDASTMAYIRLLGDINRQIAERAEQVIEVVAGIPIFIKKDGI